VDGPRPAVVRELPVTSAPRVEAAGLGISCLAVAAMELEATAEGGEGLRLEWSADGRTWNSDRNGLDLPLVADGRRHTYFLDLAASAAWKSAGTVDALRLRRRGGRGTARIHGWRLTRGADVGPAARGTFRTAEGATRAVLSVEGGAADGRLWVRPRRPVRITVSSPAPSGQPAPFLLMVKRGLPGPSDAFDLSAFDVPGKLCFRPHLVAPPGVGVAGVADSTGLDSGAFMRPGPAPATFEVPLGVVHSGDTLVLQAVFTGRHKGVSNAIVIRVR